MQSLEEWQAEVERMNCPFERIRDYPGCFEDCPDTDACPHKAALCATCGKEPQEWGNLCQMCWEAWCSEQWWATEGGMTCPLAVAADRRDQARAKLEAILNSEGIASGTTDSS